MKVPGHAIPIVSSAIADPAAETPSTFSSTVERRKASADPKPVTFGAPSVQAKRYAFATKILAAHLASDHEAKEPIAKKVAVPVPNKPVAMEPFEDVPTNPKATAEVSLAPAAADLFPNKALEREEPFSVLTVASEPATIGDVNPTDAIATVASSASAFTGAKHVVQVEPLAEAELFPAAFPSGMCGGNDERASSLLTDPLIMADLLCVFVLVGLSCYIRDRFVVVPLLFR